MSIPQWQPPPGASPRQLRQWRKEMQEWIGHVLDWRTESKLKSAGAKVTSAEEYFERSAIEAARQGNVEMLRLRYKNIAEFIHAPTKGRGKHSRWRGVTAIDVAVEDAAFVRLLWREVYGRKNRSREDNASAEKLIAEYYAEMGRSEVTEHAIAQRMKKYIIPPLVRREDEDLAHRIGEAIRLQRRNSSL